MVIFSDTPGIRLRRLRAREARTSAAMRAPGGCAITTPTIRSIGRRTYEDGDREAELAKHEAWLAQLPPVPASRRLAAVANDTTPALQGSGRAN